MCLLASDDGHSSLLEEGGGGGYCCMLGLGEGEYINQTCGLCSLVQLQGCEGEPGVCLLASDDGHSSLLERGGGGVIVACWALGRGKYINQTCESVLPSSAPRL